MIEEDIAAFRSDTSGSITDNSIVMGRSLFSRMYRGLERSSFVASPNLLAEAAYETLLDGNDLQPNYIPIGLLQVQGEVLTAEQIEENLAARYNNNPITET